MNKLGGLARNMPRTTAVWMVSIGSMMGIPLMSGFASKWLVYSAALEKGMFVPALAAWIASIGTVFIGVKATSEVFLGDFSENTKNAHESPALMTLGMGLLTAATAVLGIAPQLAMRLVINPVLAALGMPAAVGVSWFGMTDAMGSWSASIGLGMAVVSAIIGGIVYFAVARPAARAVMVGGGSAYAQAVGGGAFTGGEPMVGTGRLPASDFSAVLKRQWEPVLNGLNVDAFYLRIWKLLEGLSTAMQRAIAWLEDNSVITLIFGLSVVFAGMRVLAPDTVLNLTAGSTDVPPLIQASSAVALLVLVATALSSKVWRQWAGLMFLSGAPAVIGLFVESTILRLILLETSSLLAALLIWKSARSMAGVWTFLTVIVTSGAIMIPGLLLLDHGRTEWIVRALLVVGFCLKLGLVPFFLWLPKVAERVPALVIGLIICVLDIAAFGELCVIARSAPFILEPKGLWLAGAATSTLLAAILMLSQRNLKRLLAVSTVEDISFLIFGLATSTAIGFRGAVLGAATHALAKALLFISISSPEANGDLHDDSRGLAGRYPVSAAGFLVGMLAMLGIPPTLGFVARWRIYETGAQLGNVWLAVLIASSMCALIAYVRALTGIWWGASPQAAEASPKLAESSVRRICIVFLAAVLVIAGVLPNGLELLMRGMR
jgi:formate hydrogenlyase subunit 3/multisubunit Na+/H+ antiporter MnhD subunit